MPLTSDSELRGKKEKAKEEEKGNSDSLAYA